MEIVLDLIKILLPAGLVLYAMYLLTRNFIQRELRHRALDLRTKNQEIILPLRLQAYERMTLFLERITPNNLIMRVNQSNLESAQLHQLLLKEIRDEFNHNLSQQVYMSEQAWELIRSAMQETIMVINLAGEEVEPEEKSIVLAKKIFEKVMEKDEDPIQLALKYLKEEIQTYFG